MEWLLIGELIVMRRVCSTWWAWSDSHLDTAGWLWSAPGQAVIRSYAAQGEGARTLAEFVRHSRDRVAGYVRCLLLRLRDRNLDDMRRLRTDYNRLGRLVVALHGQHAEDSRQAVSSCEM